MRSASLLTRINRSEELLLMVLYSSFMACSLTLALSLWSTGESVGNVVWNFKKSLRPNERVVLSRTLSLDCSNSRSGLLSGSSFFQEPKGFGLADGWPASCRPAGDGVLRRRGVQLIAAICRFPERQTEWRTKQSRRI
jgi:hypothetical protein